MGKVRCEISMSLDGFVTDRTYASGMGWATMAIGSTIGGSDAKTETDAAIVDEIMPRPGRS